MSKYGHSQTAKIKSKLLFLLLLFVVHPLQSVARTIETIKMFTDIDMSTLLFKSFFFWIFLLVGASLMPPPPRSSQKLSAIKKLFKAWHIIEVGQKDGMKSRIKPIFKCNSNIWMFFSMAFSVMDLHAADENEDL